MAFIGWLLRRRRPRLARTLIGTAFVLLFALSTPLVATWPTLWAQTPPGTEPPADAEAIVVLGGDVLPHAPEYGGATVGPLTLERLRYAAHLHRATGLPLLVSGGVVRTGWPPVAKLMRQVLEDDFGVPVRWIEPHSASTAENASLTAAILAGAGVRRIVLVTHAWHAPRALASLREVGLEATAAPTIFADRPLLEVAPSPVRLGGNLTLTLLGTVAVQVFRRAVAERILDAAGATLARGRFLEAPDYVPVPFVHTVKHTHRYDGRVCRM